MVWAMMAHLFPGAGVGEKDKWLTPISWLRKICTTLQHRAID